MEVPDSDIWEFVDATAIDIFGNDLLNLSSKQKYVLFANFIHRKMHTKDEAELEVFDRCKNYIKSTI